MLKAMEQATREDWTEKVEKAEGDVLVDYWAEWCGPCRMVAPELEKLEGLREHFKVVKVNVDEQPELARQAGVLSIPTMVLMRSGSEVGRIVGAMRAEQLSRKIDEFAT
jgi:thioredoxin 1